MSVRRFLAVALIGLLLVGTVGGANAVILSERTVLNAGFVDRTISEEEGYDSLEDQVEGVIGEQVREANIGGGQLPASLERVVNVSAAVDSAITRAYVRNQSRTNLRHLYAYLHGDRSEPGLAVELRPLKDRLGMAISSQLQTVDIPPLVAEFAPETAVGPLEITGERVERMTANASGYQSVRTEVHDQFRAQLFERYRAENPGLLLAAIGINPRQYETEAERRQAVDNNEAEIRAQIRESTVNNTGDRIDQAYTQALEQAQTQLTDQIRTQTNESMASAPTNITQALIDLQLAVLGGLTDDRSYERFYDEFEDAESRLTSAAASIANQRINTDVPDRVNLTERLTDRSREQLSQVKAQIQLVDLLQWILPVVAILLIGLVYLLTRSVQTVAGTVGSAFTVVGLSGIIGARAAQQILTDIIQRNMTSPDQADLRAIATGVIDNVTGTLEGQSLVVLLVGLICLIGWGVLRNDLLED